MKDQKKYVCRTEAQKICIAAGADDIRTAVDGFPMVCFYRTSHTSNDLTFMGQYNFINDKGSYEVFGFEDIEELTEFIMNHMDDFTHFNEQGRAKMVDVGEKGPTHRTAVAGARVFVSRETFALIRSGGMKKGDVLTVAQIAGVMGAKRTPELIPMCHPVQVNGIDLTLSLDEARCCVNIRAAVSCDGRTGVEMEALTAASTAALTVYDMCKAVQKDIVISDIRLLEKTGGVHGDFRRGEDLL